MSVQRLGTQAYFVNQHEIVAHISSQNLGVVSRIGVVDLVFSDPGRAELVYSDKSSITSRRLVSGSAGVELVARVRLTHEQQTQMSLWLEEFKARQRRPSRPGTVPVPAVSFPHDFWELDRRTGRRRVRRISLAGMVYEAFGVAGVSLVETTELPKVSFRNLQDWFPELGDKSTAQKFGFTDPDADYKVLLSGYLLHGAEKLTSDGSPLAPEPGHEVWQ